MIFSRDDARKVTYTILEYIDGLEQDCSISIANAPEILQSCNRIVSPRALCRYYDMRLLQDV